LCLLKNMNIEFHEKDIKETLEELNIPFDDIYCLSDGSYGYWTILTSNLEEEHEDFLLKLGFKQIESDLWIKRIEGFEYIPSDKIIELRKVTQEKLWNECLELIKGINSICHSEKRKPIFKPTTNLMESSSKLKGFLCTNYESLSIFCEHLYKYIVESSGSGSRLPESFKRDSFYISLKELRNHLKHDREHGEDGEVHKKHEKVSKIFLELIMKKWPIEINDFIDVQLRLLENCRNWLKKLAESLNIVNELS